MTSFEPGTEVKVAYTGYTIQATILERTRDGEVYHNGWYPVRQNIGVDALGNIQKHNDYTDRPLDERPEFLAGEEYISLMDEPVKPGPMENMARALGYDV